MTKKLRILHSLWLTLFPGNAGIPQDTRLIFSALSECESLELDGFLFSKRKKFLFRQPKVSKLDLQNRERGNQYLIEAIEDISNKRHLSIVQKLQLLPSLIYSNKIQKRKYNLHPFDFTHSKQLWEMMFSKTLDEDDKNSVMNHYFYHSDLSWRDVIYGIYFNQKVHLNTDSYDFVIFPDVRPITVSAQTKKIIRYHDSFCFLCPDFFQTMSSMMHLNSLKACIKDSYFVCNSKYTHDTLISIYPEIISKSFVIPPIVKTYQKKKDWNKLKLICKQRFSKQSYTSALDFEEKNRELNSQVDLEYILALSTLEPRKNYKNLIHAWETVGSGRGKKIKLILVANPGWFSSEIELLMKPHLESGDIIHLEHVTQDEIPYLFSHALFFATLSFTEGFGIPPIEAMHCECPILASDNLAHRWSIDDAAVYVNPYDVNSISDGMVKLLEFPKEQRESLIRKGLKRVEYYHIDTIRSQWLDLFKELKEG